jgi:hypothetical protein
VTRARSRDQARPGQRGLRGGRERPPAPGVGPLPPAVGALPAARVLPAGSAVQVLPAVGALPAARVLPAGRALPAAGAPVALLLVGERMVPAAGPPVLPAGPLIPAAGPLVPAGPGVPAVGPRCPGRPAVRSRTLPGGSSLAPARFATCLLKIFPRKARDILNKGSQLFPCCSPAARGPGGR